MGKLKLIDSLSGISNETETSTVSEEQENYINFIDENGNVTQINKKDKERLKYYIDEKIDIAEQACVIGINDPKDGDCSYGIGLGLGDNAWGYAKYD